ncbi:WD domain, g-beta repeat domain-containing protein [Ditylenchus destructor]|nr:WD domain, g-beta repeat domain-containing protein [Ditylenchus destructor]
MNDQPILISAGMDGSIRFWDVTNQKNTVSLPYKESQVNSLCITPDGTQLAVATWQNLRMYSLREPTTHGLHTFSVHDQKNVTAVGFQQDGKWMYTGGEDGQTKVWDLRGSQLNCQRIFQVNTAVHSVALHPNQVELLVADSTGAIYVWDLRTDRDDSLLTELDIAEYVMHVEIDKSGRQCAAVTNRGHLMLWNCSHAGMMALAGSSPQMGTTPNMSPVPQAVHQQLTNSAPSQQMPLASQQQSRFWGVHDDAEHVNGNTNGTALLPPIAPAPPPPPELSAMVMPVPLVAQSHQQPGNNALSNGIETNNVARRNTQMNDIGHFQQQPFPNPVYMPQQQVPAIGQQMIPPGYYPHAQQILTPILNTSPGGAGNVQTTLRPCAKIRAHTTFALKCRFTPDGLAVASTSADQSTKLWSVTNHKLLNAYSAKNKWVWDCAFTNDARFMVTASSDGMMRMWDLDNKEVVRTYVGHSLGITAMTFRDSS